MFTARCCHQIRSNRWDESNRRSWVHLPINLAERRRNFAPPSQPPRKLLTRSWSEKIDLDYSLLPRRHAVLLHQSSLARGRHHALAQPPVMCPASERGLDDGWVDAEDTWGGGGHQPWCGAVDGLREPARHMTANVALGRLRCDGYDSLSSVLQVLVEIALLACCLNLSGRGCTAATIAGTTSICFHDDMISKASRWWTRLNWLPVSCS
jgi:hypothetical protein